MSLSAQRAAGAIAVACVFCAIAAGPGSAADPTPVPPEARTAGAAAPGAEIGYLNDDFTDRALAAMPVRSTYEPLIGYTRQREFDVAGRTLQPSDGKPSAQH